jgi:hypothetical protein
MHQPSSEQDERRSVTQMINTGGIVEERLEDLQISDQINASDEQKRGFRQNLDRVVCTYHPGRVREKVFRIQDVICNTDPRGSDSHVVSYMLRLLGAFHQQTILQSWTSKTV